MDKHTPTPWNENVARLVKAGDGTILANGKPFTVDVRVLSEPNYQLALRAVNSHDQLVAALEACREAMSDESPLWTITTEDYNEMKAQADAALALAREETCES